MVEINLGNKTLVIGLAIAFILAYGMVNFNSVKQADFAFPKAEAVTQLPQAVQQVPAAQPAGAEPAEQVADASMPASETSDNSTVSPRQPKDIDAYLDARELRLRERRGY